MPSSSTTFQWDAHHRFIVSVLVTALVFFLLKDHVAFATDVVASWNIFSIANLIPCWLYILTKDPYEARRSARLQDSSRTFLFVLVTSAATVSLLAVGLLLGDAKNLSHPQLVGHIALSISAILFSWLLVHTLFALRYAHAYYDKALTTVREKISGGLIFPAQENPGYIDFAYFSFVIGMTCQVSDVQVAATDLRRLALVHGLISFGFNTAILAVFVNIVAGLL